MAKTNFTKAELAFEEERRKQFREELLKEADRVSGKASDTNPQIELQQKIIAERKVLVKALQNDLKIIDEDVFDETIKFSKDKLERLLKRGIDLTDDDYEILAKVKKRIEKYKNTAVDFDDKLIEDGRKKHINKRFNVREKWLPLK